MTDTIMNKNEELIVVSEQAKKAKRNALIGKILVYAALIIYAVIILFPFSVVIFTSLLPWEDASAMEFMWISKNGFSLEGYKMAWEYNAAAYATDTPSLLLGFFNTLMYVLPPTCIGLLVGSMAAYAFAKLRFRASNIMYTSLIATMMIPGTITLAPSYWIYGMINWVGTPLPLIIPGLFSSAACVFFMRQFFTGIPDSIIEAAKLDGVGFVGIFFTMILPLSVPALLAQGLLGFIGGYNDYLGPLLYLMAVPERATLQIMLTKFATARSREMNAVMAGTLIVLLPLLIIYFIAQDFFLEGIAASAIKG